MTQGVGSLCLLCFFLFWFSGYFIMSQIFWQLSFITQLDPNLVGLESWFGFRSQLGPSIYPSSSSSAQLQVITKYTHLLKDCYPQLVSNPCFSEILPPKQLDCRYMPLHSTKDLIKHCIWCENMKVLLQSRYENPLTTVETNSREVNRGPMIKTKDLT